MEWLAQNWIWIVFAIGIFLLMRRGGMSCGMGGGHSHGGGHAHRHGEGPDRQGDSDGQIKDPVSGEIVNPDTAVNAMYQGRVYYFASRDNREKFEASPAQYASRADESGHRHRRHGC